MSIISHLNKFGKANNTQNANKTEKINNDNKENKDVHYANMLNSVEVHDTAYYKIEMVDEQEQKYFNDKIEALTKTKAEIEKKLEDMPKGGFFKSIRNQMSDELNKIETQIKQLQKAKIDDTEKDKYVKVLEAKREAYVNMQKKLPMGFGHQFDDKIKKLDEELAILKN